MTKGRRPREYSKGGELIEPGQVLEGDKLSGHAYVPVVLRGDTPGISTIGRIKVYGVTDNCNHGVSMCVKCAHSWLWDHEILWNRTAAGRKLNQEYEVEQGHEREPLWPGQVHVDTGPIVQNEWPETHNQGVLTIDNHEIIREMNLTDIDFGLQVSRDGRVWVCLNGAAFIRFKPHARVIQTGEKDG